MTSVEAYDLAREWTYSFLIDNTLSLPRITTDNDREDYYLEIVELLSRASDQLEENPRNLYFEIECSLKLSWAFYLGECNAIQTYIADRYDY